MRRGTFFKPYPRRVKYCSLRDCERGKFDFDHHFAFWPFSWEDGSFCLTASFSACREDYFQEKFVQNRPSLNWFRKIRLRNLLHLFIFKTFLKGKHFAGPERGVNSILITILRFWPSSWKDRTFCLTASFSARWKDHFQKNVCPKRTFRLDFVKFVRL